jgi:anti-sigma B factor antagonist
MTILESIQLDAFSVDVRPDRERVIVAPHGELDMAHLDEVEDAIDDLTAAGFHDIVLDLRGLTFLDSTGLCCILRQVQREDAAVRLIDGSEPVRRLFDITGVRAGLPFIPDHELRRRG